MAGLRFLLSFASSPSPPPKEGKAATGGDAGGRENHKSTSPAAIGLGRSHRSSPPSPGDCWQAALVSRTLHRAAAPPGRTIYGHHWRTVPRRQAAAADIRAISARFVSLSPLTSAQTNAFRAAVRACRYCPRHNHLHDLFSVAGN